MRTESGRGFGASWAELGNFFMSLDAAQLMGTAPLTYEGRLLRMILGMPAQGCRWTGLSRLVSLSGHGPSCPWLPPGTCEATLSSAAFC